MKDDVLINALLAEPLVTAAQRRGFRPRVGVSACLLGERVRYDGDHRRIALVADFLPRFVDCVSLCPEVAIGLGVPRPTIQRVRLADGREIVRGVEDRALDVTASLAGYAQQVTAAQLLHGYVFKARSPSCAPGDTPVYDESGKRISTGWGLYAEGVRQAWPGLLVCDEETLAAPGRFEAFVREVCRRAAGFPVAVPDPCRISASQVPRS